MKNEIAGPMLNFSQVAPQPRLPIPDGTEDQSEPSLPGCVRVPAHMVRIAKPRIVEEAEWDRVAYEVGKAVDQYFEASDANTQNS